MRDWGSESSFLAYLAMAEAKLGHRAEAEAALAEYPARRAKELATWTGPLPDDPLLAEAEEVAKRSGLWPDLPANPFTR